MLILQPWNNGPLLTWAERNSLVPSDTPAPIRLLLAPGTCQHNPIGLTFSGLHRCRLVLPRERKKGRRGKKNKATLTNHFFVLHKRGFQGSKPSLLQHSCLEKKNKTLFRTLKYFVLTFPQQYVIIWEATFRKIGTKNKTGALFPRFCVHLRYWNILQRMESPHPNCFLPD